jgi:hypothetical protein
VSERSRDLGLVTFRNEAVSVRETAIRLRDVPHVVQDSRGRLGPLPVVQSPKMQQYSSGVLRTRSVAESATYLPK